MASNNGEVFRDLRLSKRLTQQQFAEALGVSQSHVAHIEAGRRDISRATQIRLAQIVDVGESLSFFEHLKEIEQIIPFKHNASNQITQGGN